MVYTGQMVVTYLHKQVVESFCLNISGPNGSKLLFYKMESLRTKSVFYIQHGVPLEQGIP
jgi:hypothetical protein